MPAALAAIHDYAEAGLAALKAFPLPTLGRIIISRPENWTPPTLPRIPSESIATLQTCIETGDVVSRREIAKLLTDLQVCGSNLRDAVEDLSPGSDTSVPSLTHDSQIGANQRICVDAKNRADCGRSS
jgi:hypothetical protein